MVKRSKRILSHTPTTMNLRTGISFIVAAYNLNDLLIRCVESIQQQTETNIEIIIINDRSTDNTLEIAHKLCINDTGFKTKCISHIKNLGLPAARNTGFDAASFKYIWHIDGDDYLPGKQVASSILDALESNHLLALKIPIFDETDERPFSGTWYEKKCFPTFNCIAVDATSVEREFGHSGAFSIVYSKKFAEDFSIKSLENVSIGEDQILCSQLLRKLPCIGLSNIPLYVYDKTRPSMMRTKWQLSKYLEDRIYFHFLNLQFMHQYWRRKTIFEARHTYIANNLSKRARKDLEGLDYHLISLCHYSDYCQYSLQKHPVVMADQKFKHVYKYLFEQKEEQFANIFDKTFQDTEFIVLAGAHKTGSTYMQSLLSINKYKIALHGIIYIDYQIFRSTFLVDQKFEKMTNERIKSELLKLCVPLLFRIPKKVIIYDENLIKPAKSYWTGDFGKCFACTKNGFNTKALFRLLKVLPPQNTSLIYCIRNFVDYIPSMYCEYIKWGPFASFKDYTSNLLQNEGSISWSYILDHLLDLAKGLQLKKVLFFSFEDIASDFGEFIGSLIQVDLTETIPDVHANDVNFTHRSAPSKELIDLTIRLQQKGNNPSSVQKLYKKLNSIEYGTSQYKPFSNSSSTEDISLQLHQLYEGERAKWTNHNFNLLAGRYSLIKRKKDSISFESLISINSPAERWLTFRQANKSEDCQNEISDIKEDILRPYKYKNLENLDSYDIKRTPYKLLRDHGISAMIRVKNEEKNIKRVLRDCQNIFDEIVIVDNGSTDRTLDFIKESMKSTSSNTEIKVYSYPFVIARCGEENWHCAENSVHSLAYFYNFALSKCTQKYVCKWDGDMLIPKNMKNKLLDFKSKVLTMTKQSNSKPLMEVPIGITVFRGIDKLLYYKPNESESEIRFFRNSTDILYVKDILWERLYTVSEYDLIMTDAPVFIEYKDVNENEFSHWQKGDLGMGIRKRRELANFNQIINLTKDGNSPSKEVLNKHGFDHYTEDIHV